MLYSDGDYMIVKSIICVYLECVWWSCSVNGNNITLKGHTECPAKLVKCDSSSSIPFSLSLVVWKNNVCTLFLLSCRCYNIFDEYIHHEYVQILGLVCLP